MTDPTVIRGRFALRRKTAAEWSAGNTILAEGEEGWEKDTKRRKVGDGVAHWNALPYDASDALRLFGVRDFGAVGDGTADDTAAIAAANTAAHVAGGIVYFPPGRYKTSATITVTQSNVSWIGAGAGAVSLEPSNASPCIRWYEASFIGNSSVPYSKLRSGTLQGFSINGNINNPMASGKVGIRYGTIQNGYWEDIKIAGFGQTGQVGLIMDSTTDQGTEGTIFNGVEFGENKINALWTVTGAGSNSFGYTRMHNMRFTCQSGQTCMRLENGAAIYNSVVDLTANLTEGILLDLDAGHLTSGEYRIHAEGTNTAGVGIKLRNGSELTGHGMIDLQDGPLLCTNMIVDEISPIPQSMYQLTGSIRLPGETSYAINTNRSDLPLKVSSAWASGPPGIEFAQNHPQDFYYNLQINGASVYSSFKRFLWLCGFTGGGRTGAVVLSPNGSVNPLAMGAATVVDSDGTLVTAGGKIVHLTKHTANYTVVNTDEVVVMEGTGLTVTIPAASSVVKSRFDSTFADTRMTSGVGRKFTITNSTSSGGPLTLASSSALPVTTLAVGATITLIFDGTLWQRAS